MIRREVSIHGRDINHNEGCYLLDSSSDAEGDFFLLVELPSGKIQSVYQGLYVVRLIGNKGSEDESN